ncbi:hypothetical protein BCR44DRAFT_73254 [Catenaria anguillulae PL171]|uniref:B30.2/SPRY domain-containing protein n=1 Tax=Catenaria anguillulae PL171 TaxID=765915 RepID=A0A1Y2HT99_9FUNG|nr:hypothetical protein BCR44DRAFT_73254 [Catenaria anguillulae PL171]
MDNTASPSIPLLLVCAVTGALMAYSTRRLDARQTLHRTHNDNKAKRIADTAAANASSSANNVPTIMPTQDMDRQTGIDGSTASLSGQYAPMPNPMAVLKNAKYLEQVIPLESLAELSQTTSILLRGSATKILLERAAHEPHLSFILEGARQADDPKTRLKSFTVLQHLAKLEDQRQLLLDQHVPELCCSTLVDETIPTDVYLLKEAVVTLYELVCTDEQLRQHLIERHELMQGLRRCLTISTHRDLLNWAVFLLHNLAMCESLQRTLATNNFIPLLGSSLRITYGNWTLQKLCLHALVRLIGSLDPPAVAQSALLSLAPFNLVSLLSAALRQEDPELVYWALGVVHECAVKDAFRAEMRAADPLIRSVAKLVDPSVDLGATKLALRVLKFLGLRDHKFHRELVDSYALVGRVMTCMSVVDEQDVREPDNEDDDDALGQDTRYWALTLLHDLAPHPGAAMAILAHKEFHQLASLVASPRALVPLYVVDVISYVCAAPEVTAMVALNTRHAGLLETVVRLVRHTDPDVSAGGLACMFNLVTLAPAGMMAALRGIGADVALANLLLEPVATPQRGGVTNAAKTSGRARIDVLCAKLAVMMALAPADHPLTEGDPVAELLAAQDLPLLDPDEIIEWVVDYIFQPYVLGVVIEASHTLVGTLCTVLAEHRRRRAHALGGQDNQDEGGNSMRPPSIPWSMMIARPSPVTEMPPEPAMSMSESELVDAATSALVRVTSDRMDGALQVAQLFAQFPRIMAVVFDRHPDIIEIYVDAIYDLVMFPLVDEAMELKPERPWPGSALGGGHYSDSVDEEQEANDAGAEVQECFKIKLSLATLAMQALAAMFSYEPVQAYLADERFISTLIACMRMYPTNLAEPVMSCLAVCARNMSRNAIITTPWLMDVAWYVLAYPGPIQHKESTSPIRSGLTLFAARSILTGGLNLTPWIGHGKFVCLSNVDRSLGLLVDAGGSEVWNPGWAFESVRATHGAASGGKWMYEVELLTAELLQLGWASALCHYDMPCGRGIGDDDHSYAYDGDRRRAWHGLIAHAEGIPYGQAWKVGDVIGCCLDLDAGNIEYFHNGVSMGVAFRNINMGEVWYPALSLSAAQGCRVRFGNAYDPIRFPCANYTPLGCGVDQGYVHLSPHCPVAQPTSRPESPIQGLASPLTRPSSTSSPLQRAKEVLFESLPTSPTDIHLLAMLAPLPASGPSSGPPSPAQSGSAGSSIRGGRATPHSTFDFMGPVDDHDELPTGLTLDGAQIVEYFELKLCDMRHHRHAVEIGFGDREGAQLYLSLGTDECEDPSAIGRLAVFNRQRQPSMSLHGTQPPPLRPTAMQFVDSPTTLSAEDTIGAGLASFDDRSWFSTSHYATADTNHGVSAFFTVNGSLVAVVPLADWSHSRFIRPYFAHAAGVSVALGDGPFLFALADAESQSRIVYRTSRLL